MPCRARSAAVRIDFTSAWVSSSVFNAAQPTTRSPSRADQKTTPGARRPSRSSAWVLSGGVSERSWVTWSSRNAIVSLLVRSSTSIRT